MKEIFSKRRMTILEQLGEDAIVVLPAAVAQLRSNDVEYPFRQDNDFLYLTNFHEPDAIAVIMLRGGQRQIDYTLFCLPKDPVRELWNGECVGCKKAVRDYEANRAYPLNQFEEIFAKLVGEKKHCYFTQPSSLGWQWSTQLKRLLGASNPHCEFARLEPVMHEMRLYKSQEEIDLMKRAADISTRAHIRAMQFCRPGCYEYEVEAEMNYVFQQANATHAYPSIVGGGKNACTLHYIDNQSKLKSGDMLLIDAGAEYQHYASDISRTYPVNGKFSIPQRDIYEVVLQAQEAAIAQVKPGNRIDCMHNAAVKALTMGLKELGLLKGNLESLIQSGAYRQFYMHNTGHWLGMDVHDAGAYQLKGQWRSFKPGMVTTVEPGLYIRPDKNIPKCFWNIGVRIEDDVVVTDSGADVITKQVPRTPSAIEACMNAK